MAMIIKYIIDCIKDEIWIIVKSIANNSLVFENIKFSPINLKNIYLQRSLNLPEQSHFKNDDIIANSDTIDIAEKAILRLFGSEYYSGILIKKEYYSAARIGINFNLVISYSNKEQKKELEEILGTLKFE